MEFMSWNKGVQSAMETGPNENFVEMIIKRDRACRPFQGPKTKRNVQRHDPAVARYLTRAKRANLLKTIGEIKVAAVW